MSVKSCFKKIKHNLVIIINRIIFRIVFTYNKLTRIDNNLVIFADFRRSEMPDNMTGIYKLCQKNGYDCKTFFSNNEAKTFKQKLRRFQNEMDFFKLYAKCRVLILDDYYPNAYEYKPRKKTKVIQLWHGCGAFKRFGYSTVNTNWGLSKKKVKKSPIHNTYTHVMVSSEKVIPCYAEAFNCSEKIIHAWGAPRTDVFYDNSFIDNGKKKLLRLYPEIGEKRIILYAPTYRGNNLKESFVDDVIDYKELFKNFSDKYVIVNKLHPLLSNNNSNLEKYKATYKDFIFDVTDKMTIDEAMCAADIVITDYSSLIFEYSLLERPMIFYAYDLNSYDEGRGFYFPYEDFVPGPIVMNNEEIIMEIEKIEQDFDKSKVIKFKKDFMSGCDGKCTERIYNNILKR